MMGAMPAVAVRLERRKAEQRLKRPSQLYLAGYPHLRQQATSPSRGNSPSPSPLLSPPRFEEDQRLPEIYVCGRVSALHLAVVSLLLGAVILIVGLVQLKPGADAPGHRYYLIGVGCFLEVLGLIITATRCIMLHLKIKKKRNSISSNTKKCEKIFHEPSSSQIEAKKSNILVNGKSQNIPQMDSLSPSDLEIPKPVNMKQLYNSSDVMYIDEMSDTPDRKSKSPVESVHTIDVVMGGTLQEPATTFTDTCSLTKVSPIDFDNFICQPSQKGTKKSMKQKKKFKDAETPRVGEQSSTRPRISKSTRGNGHSTNPVSEPKAKVPNKHAVHPVEVIYEKKEKKGSSTRKKYKMSQAVPSSFCPMMTLYRTISNKMF